jgi:hypothetical protein
MSISDIKQRADGKYSVLISFAGAPNMFGGRDFGKSFRKIVSAERLEELKRQVLIAKDERR